MLGQDIGIDLGTSNVLVYIKGKGIVYREPSVVAVESIGGKIIAIGAEAQKMLGRTPGNITAIKPIREGVISNYSIAEKMIRHFINEAAGKSLLATLTKPRITFSVPSNITEIEERAVIDAGLQAGAGRVRLIEEPLAAALGVGIDLDRSKGHVIADIGGGTCDIAVVASSGVVVSDSVKIAGDSFDEAIIRYIRKKYNVLIGERSAEQLKIKIGCVYRRDRLLAMEARGRSLVTGLPKTIQISGDEVLEALKEPASSVITAIRTLLEKTPSEYIEEICRNGIILTGGCSKIYGMTQLIRRELDMRSRVADAPETCVVTGIGKAMNNPKLLKK